MELISRESAIREYAEICDKGHFATSREMAEYVFAHVPTIESRPRGEWKQIKELTKGKRILDPCCGGRMFWFDKNNRDVVFCDNRELETILCDGRAFSVKPDIVCDFTDMPFKDNTFYHIVFDPPHMNTLGEESWMAQKYGTLKGIDWKALLHDGFAECMRVLKPNGTLIFKWNEQDIPVKQVLAAIGYEPLYGHKSGKLQKTHWMAFMKNEAIETIPKND